jgi:hypothetical protein
MRDAYYYCSNTALVLILYTRVTRRSSVNSETRRPCMMSRSEVNHITTVHCTPPPTIIHVEGGEGVRKLPSYSGPERNDGVTGGSRCFKLGPDLACATPTRRWQTEKKRCIGRSHPLPVPQWPAGWAYCAAL